MVIFSDFMLTFATLFYSQIEHTNETGRDFNPNAYRQ